MGFKEKFLHLTENIQLPLYFQPWWLDITAENWDVVLSEKKGNISGLWLYTKSKKMFFTLSLMPAFTQRFGVLIFYPQGQKYESRLAYEKKIIFSLFESLPSFDFFSQNLDYRITNILPFHWLGFRNNVRYTYMILNSDIENLYKILRGNVRRNIKKAENKNVKVKIIDDIEVIVQYYVQVFLKKNKKIPFSPDYLREIDKAAKKRNQRKIYAAFFNNKIISAIYILNDNEHCYYLIGGFEESYKSFGAVSLLMWNAISDCIKTKRIFDFEGSMNEDIENFFRGFGATQVPFYNIFKFRSKVHCVLNCIKKIV